MTVLSHGADDGRRLAIALGLELEVQLIAELCQIHFSVIDNRCYIYGYC